MVRGLLAVAVIACVVAVGCGGGGGGGGCGTPGGTSKCSAGDVCTNLSGDGNRCRKICQQQSDCPVGQNCEGVANTNIKSCQPVPAPTVTP